MATVISRITISSIIYTQITAGETNALMNNVGGHAVRIAAAATVPAVAVTDYITIRGNESLAAGTLTQNLWAMITPSTEPNPATRNGVLEVMKG